MKYCCLEKETNQIVFGDFTNGTTLTIKAKEFNVDEFIKQLENSWNVEINGELTKEKRDDLLEQHIKSCQSISYDIDPQQIYLIKDGILFKEEYENVGNEDKTPYMTLKVLGQL